MGFDPTIMFKFNEMKKRFQKDHPKVVQFFEHESFLDLPEGTVIELTITRPGESPVSTNLKLNAEDVRDLQSVRH
jgi:hypothetical protein